MPMPSSSLRFGEILGQIGRGRAGRAEIGERKDFGCRRNSNHASKVK